MFFYCSFRSVRSFTICSFRFVIFSSMIFVLLILLALFWILLVTLFTSAYQTALTVASAGSLNNCMQSRNERLELFEEWTDHKISVEISLKKLKKNDTLNCWRLFVKSTASVMKQKKNMRKKMAQPLSRIIN